jgi:DNA-binding CsgD family transcriptional regulator
VQKLVKPTWTATSLPRRPSRSCRPLRRITALLLRLHGLSAREREVARLLLLGAATDEIAAQLSISRYTLRDHVTSIFAKFGASSRAELMALGCGNT